MNSASSRSHAVFTLVVDTAVQIGVPQQAETVAVGPHQGAPGEAAASGVVCGGVGVVSG